jgi:hypothetical protein
MLWRPATEVQEHHVLDLLGRLSQPTAKDSEKDHAEVGMILEDRQKIPAVQNHEFAVRHRRRVRAPLLAVEHCDFAEDVAGVEDGKNDFFPPTESELILTLPRKTAIKHCPGDPLAKISRPAE